MTKTVIVGMSGGVDSSVTAALMKDQGYRVIGLFMKNWEEEEEGSCSAAEDYADVAAVCQQLQIPYYAVNFAKEYWDHVFAQCLEDFRAGYTPNPDILCNREIKFKVFFQKALELGADFVATGHYCRKLEHSGQCQLGRGHDPDKDQSYFLYTLKKEILQQVLFPVGELNKSEVRAIAESRGLATAKKKDSTGICFIGKRNFRDFLSRYIVPQPGPLMRLDGEVVGEHEGVAFYTIGQRKGLGIGGKGEAWFVIGKDPVRNVVYVEQGEDHPALYSRELIATDVTWVGGEGPPLPFSCTAKIRYRSPDVPCTLFAKDKENLHVQFHSPQKAVTPRQSIVFYQGQLCLGGGMISVRV